MILAPGRDAGGAAGTRAEAPRAGLRVRRSPYHPAGARARRAAVPGPPLHLGAGPGLLACGIMPQPRKQGIPAQRRQLQVHAPRPWSTRLRQRQQLQVRKLGQAPAGRTVSDSRHDGLPSHVSGRRACAGQPPGGVSAAGFSPPRPDCPSGDSGPARRRERPAAGTGPGLPLPSPCPRRPGAPGCTRRTGECPHGRRGCFPPGRTAPPRPGPRSVPRQGRSRAHRRGTVVNPPVRRCQVRVRDPYPFRSAAAEGERYRRGRALAGAGRTRAARPPNRDSSA